MRSLSQCRDAIDIFVCHNGDINYAFAAEHDIIYGPESPSAGSEDAAKLEELGWHWDNEVNCWAIFT